MQGPLFNDTSSSSRSSELFPDPSLALHPAAGVLLPSTAAAPIGLLNCLSLPAPAQQTWPTPVPGPLVLVSDSSRPPSLRSAVPPPPDTTLPAVAPAVLRLQAGVPVNIHILRLLSRCGSAARTFFFPITTVGELTILAHTRGDVVIVVSPPVSTGAPSSPFPSAASWVLSTFVISSPLVFPVGYLGTPRHTVLTSPLPFAPPHLLVLRHPRERRLAQRHRPGFYFMLLSALVGATVYESASMAYARAASFRQSYDFVAEAMLAVSIIMDAAHFRFGAQALTSLVTGPHPSECAPMSIPAITAFSLSAEAELRSLLFAYVHPTDSAALTVPTSTQRGRGGRRNHRGRSGRHAQGMPAQR